MKIVPPDNPKPPARTGEKRPHKADACGSDPFVPLDVFDPAPYLPTSAPPTLKSACAVKSEPAKHIDKTQKSANSKGARHARHMRIEWADIARSLAFFAVAVITVAALFTTSSPVHVPPTLDPSIIAGAMFSPDDPIANTSALFGAFALPLLFLSIGYTMRRQKLTLAYVEELIGKYLIPYVVFGLIAAVIYGMFSPSHDMFSYLAALIYGNGGIRGEFILGNPFAQASLPVLWLLPTIAVGQLIAFSLSKLPLITRIVVAGVVFLAGTASAGHVFLPCDIQPAACAAWFMTCGSVLREQHAFSSWGWEKVMLAFSLTFGVVYCALVSLGFMAVPDYPVANYSGTIIDMLGGVCAAGCFMVLSQTIALSDSWVKRLLCWSGQNFLACLSCLSVIVACMICMKGLILELAGIVGTGMVFAAFSLAAIALSALLALAVSKIPYVCGIFTHFSDMQLIEPNRRG